MDSKLKTIEMDPFSLDQNDKEKMFLDDMRSAVKWHYDNSPEFKKLCNNRNFNIDNDYKLEDIPYFPVTIFKQMDLLSVPKDKIVKTLYSSSTSGKPSKIMIDQETIDHQVKTLNKIMMDFFKDRRRFIIFDSPETIQSKDGELSSRGTAIRGMLSMARDTSFILDNDLKVDKDELKKTIEKISADDKICFFGFTWLIYTIYNDNKDDKEIAGLLSQLMSKDRMVLHIGGWKKLKDIEISKDDFNESIGNFLNIEKGKIVDFYGMTEQLGTVYPDCSSGYKHLPLYSEIIIRDIDTLEPVKNNEVGFIQLISPLPHSYPGISILSDDLGRIVGIDDCLCGRKGKYFVFEKRSEKAEAKGCGDTIN